MTTLTAEQVRAIAEQAAEKAAKEAVRETLTALGVNMDKLHEEQQVWAFARTMHQGTRRGAFALYTGFLSALATLIAGAIWYVFSSHHSPH